MSQYEGIPYQTNGHTLSTPYWLVVPSMHNTMLRGLGTGTTGRGLVASETTFWTTGTAVEFHLTVFLTVKGFINGGRLRAM